MVSLGLRYNLTKPLQVAARLERFWDDGLARAAEIWSAETRVSVGAGYTLYEQEETSARVLVEYRLTSYRRGGAARAAAAPDQGEAFAKLQIGYR